MVFVKGLPHELEVGARRKISTVEDATKLDKELSASLTKFSSSGKTVSISDLDVSQNKFPVDQFEVLFNTVMNAGVRVVRWRLFGCPTFSDEAAEYFANYLRYVNSETAPAELHLSDCALTSAGFGAIIDAIEENDAFPITRPGATKPMPLYLRLENNFIEPSAIKEKVAAGVIQFFQKGDRSKLRGDVKVNLVGKAGDAKVQQKDGPPPAADAVAPSQKYVHEPWKETHSEQFNMAGGLESAPYWLKEQLLKAVMEAQLQAQGSQWPKGGAEWKPLGKQLPAARPVGFAGTILGKGKAAGKGLVLPNGQLKKGVAPAVKGVSATLPQKGKGLAAAQAAGARPAVPIKPKIEHVATPKVSAQFPQANQGKGGKGWAGAAGTASDRSRTPVGRGAQKGAQPLQQVAAQACNAKAWKGSQKGAQPQQQVGAQAGKGSQKGAQPQQLQSGAKAASLQTAALAAKGKGKATLASVKIEKTTTTTAASQRTTTARPVQSKASGGALPPNWEEQWSEDYQIPYFWNSVTEESSWEKPIR